MWREIYNLAETEMSRSNSDTRLPTYSRLMEQRSDEDKLDVLFGKHKLRTFRDAFEDADRNRNRVLTSQDAEAALSSLGKRATEREISNFMRSESLSDVTFVQFIHLYSNLFGEDRGGGGGRRDNNRDNRDNRDNTRGEGWRYNEREGRRDSDGWREEKWAITLGKGILRALEESFDRNSVSIRVSGGGGGAGRDSRRRDSMDSRDFSSSSSSSSSKARMLPVRRIRHALWEMDRDVTQEQARSYATDCGLRSDDQLTLAEFARCYYYLFVDAARDEKGDAGGYFRKVFGGTGLTGTSMRHSMRHSTTMPSSMMEEPVTMSGVARRVFAQGEWLGTKTQYVQLMRRLCIGRTDSQVAVLEHGMDVFVDMSEEARGEEGRPGEITTADIAVFFRTLKTTASAAKPVKKTITTVVNHKSPKRHNSHQSNSSAGQKGGGGDAGTKSNASGRDVSATSRRVTVFQSISLSYTDDMVKNATERFTQRMRKGPRDGVSFPGMFVLLLSVTFECCC
jgi:hypothetical protein